VILPPSSHWLSTEYDTVLVLGGAGSVMFWQHFPRISITSGDSSFLRPWVSTTPGGSSSLSTWVAPTSSVTSSLLLLKGVVTQTTASWPGGTPCCRMDILISVMYAVTSGSSQVPTAGGGAHGAGRAAAGAARHDVRAGAKTLASPPPEGLAYGGRC
jgi:hypothetical protein